MRWLIAAVGLLLSMPASAESVRDWTAYAKALFDHMGITYVCRSEIGEAHYLAARTIAGEGLLPYAGQEAYNMVDEFDRRFKADKRVVKLTAAQCYKLKSDAVLKINVERAKLEAE